MTDHHALVAAVAENFEDDTPRLVLADYLDDHGGEAGSLHAAFARAQVAAARAGETRVRQRWSGKKTQLHQMFDPLVWGNPEPPPATLFLHNASGTGVVWRRGMIEAVSAPAVAWLQIGHEVLRVNPVRYVHIQSASVVLPQHCPINAGLRIDWVHVRYGPWAIDVPRDTYARHAFDWSDDRQWRTRLFMESIFPGVRFVVTQFDPLRCYPELSFTGVGRAETTWPEPVGRPEWVVRRPEGEGT